MLTSAIDCSMLEVGPHDPHLLAGSHCAREHTTKSNEAAFVSCGHHLADVQAHRSFGVTLLDGFEILSPKEMKNPIYGKRNTTSPSAPTGPVYSVSAR